VGYDVVARGPGLLAQGDQSSTGIQSHAFDVVVLCAWGHQPDRRAFPRTMRVVYAPMDDATLSQHDAYVAEVASAIAARELARGRRVLVTCQAGWNRSGLVSALTLTKLYGWPGKYAVDRVKAARENALQNQSFVDYLSQIPGRRPETLVW
jgi:protein-tyrosine phosphatase